MLLLVAPSALAEHTFSHRLYVAGRLIDAEGRPAAGVSVGLATEGISKSTPCLAHPDKPTGPMGDLLLCRHVHKIPADAHVTVHAANASMRVRIDPDARHAAVSLRVQEPVPHDIAGERTFARTYVVAGSSFAMLREPREEEGVLVNATPHLENVSITIHADGKTLVKANASTDEAGRFRAELPLAEIPAGTLVLVRSGLAIVEKPASVEFRRTDVTLIEDARLLMGPITNAPGGAPTPAGAWLALAALAIVGSVARRRRA